MVRNTDRAQGLPPVLLELRKAYADDVANGRPPRQIGLSTSLTRALEGAVAQINVTRPKLDIAMTTAVANSHQGGPVLSVRQGRSYGGYPVLPSRLTIKRARRRLAMLKALRIVRIPVGTIIGIGEVWGGLVALQAFGSVLESFWK